MKELLKQTNLISLLFIAALAFLSSCSDDDMNMGVTDTGRSMTYDLASVSNPSVSGTVKFTEQSDGKTRITINLMNTMAGDMHPSHIHMNTAAESGDIIVSLTPVDGATGMSETLVDETDGGSSMSYEELLDFDGYVNVHASTSDLATLIAQGDIGQNTLTGEMMEYELDERSESGVSGMVTFYERMNNETLVVIDVDGTPEDGMHPSHIHMNTAAEGGGIAVSLTMVNGGTGLSKTNVTMTDDGMTMLTYDDLINFDGYVNIHLSMDDLATVVAQGDIGQNALTGMSQSYMLNNISGVTGEAVFHERMNGETLIEIMLEGMEFQGDHPTHIHLGSAADGPGGIALTLTSVDNMGVSRSQAAMLDDGTVVSYTDLVDFDGYINVHLSAAQLDVLLAQGDIGSNAG